MRCHLTHGGHPALPLVDHYDAVGLQQLINRACKFRGLSAGLELTSDTISAG